jgi:hypothetical protein
VTRDAEPLHALPRREIDEAALLMQRFAERTGLGSARAPRRYLWTDAFAVCNDLALWSATGMPFLLARALALVDQVHAVLGRHRPDDPRRGWLSGLSEPEGALHPTRGGLRIGKPLPERSRGTPYDERLEWDRDGQYFHYLTRWMHALDQVARATGDARFNAWARELADVAHRSFTRAGAGTRGMAWKLSIDLSRPLVPSMGQHDPVDGLVTCIQLRATANRLGDAASAPKLDGAVSDFARLVDTTRLATADPLGLGGLLVDAGRVAQLLAQRFAEPDLLEMLLDAASVGLAHYARHNELDLLAERRLAFRELGLAIGLSALHPLGQALERDTGRGPQRARLRARLAALEPYARLGTRITDFWRDGAQRRNRTWAEHADIDDVMLATSLVPEGVVVLGPDRARPA